jgi:serine/threonine protein kinase
MQEARAASALNHTGIVTIHDIRHDDDVDFIVMEYVRGLTLDRIIARSRMRVNEALRIGIRVADALSTAHAAGILRRDLKPGNIMITDEGTVKILDFGLAKLFRGDSSISDNTLTQTASTSPHQLVAGTAGYMSPEQAQGLHLDARSDIFSFDAVLYEMLTGSRAFPGDTTGSTLAAVIKVDPKSPRQLASDIPADLERIVLRCLRKDPARPVPSHG